MSDGKEKRTVDALLDAMRRRGLPAKRADALEVAAAIAGYATSNAYLKAASTAPRDRAVAPAGAPGAATLAIEVAAIAHGHGTDLRVAAAATGVDAQVAAYCREAWPDHPDGLDDAATIARYFGEEAPAETCETTVFEVELPASVEPTQPPRLDARRRHALIAGLRMIQSARAAGGIADPLVLDILEDSGDPLADGEIDELCLELNA